MAGRSDIYVARRTCPAPEGSISRTAPVAFGGRALPWLLMVAPLLYLCFSSRAMLVNGLLWWSRNFLFSFSRAFCSSDPPPPDLVACCLLFGAGQSKAEGIRSALFKPQKGSLQSPSKKKKKTAGLETGTSAPGCRDNRAIRSFAV